MGEFELIQRFFAWGSRGSQLVVENGDDCAVFRPSFGHDLAVSIDTQIQDVHFPASMPARHIAYRALACAVSDLAAMGAVPKFFTLALTLPEQNVQWLQDFSLGLRTAADHFQVSLAGGDTTRGPLTITIQVHGELPSGEAVRRDGARPEDLLLVTGTLGDAIGGLECIFDDNYQHNLAQVFVRPNPPILFAQQARPMMTSAIDVSDGFAADLAHIAKASDLGFVVNRAMVPISEALQLYAQDEVYDYALYGGDDYQLILTAPADAVPAMMTLSDEVGVRLTVIGEAVEQRGVWMRQGGDLSVLEPRGYNHFLNR